MMEDPRVTRVKMFRKTAIFIVAVAAISSHLTLMIPDHPNDYDPKRHTLVAELVIQEPERGEDDYYEYKVPGIWYEPASGQFYSINDAWHTDRVKAINSKKKFTNYAVAMAIALVLGVARWRAYQLGVRPVWSTDAWTRRRQRFFSSPPIFALVVLILGIVGAHLIHVLLRGQSLVVDAIIHNENLHKKYLGGGYEGVSEWKEDLLLSGDFPEEMLR